MDVLLENQSDTITMASQYVAEIQLLTNHNIEISEQLRSLKNSVNTSLAVMDYTEATDPQKYEHHLDLDDMRLRMAHDLNEIMQNQFHKNEEYRLKIKKKIILLTSKIKKINID